MLVLEGLYLASQNDKLLAHIGKVLVCEDRL